MPDLLPCAKMLILGVSLAGWIGVALALRFTEQPLKRGDAWTTVLATVLFIGLMGWLD